MMFLAAVREIAEFLFALIDRNSPLKGLGKQGIWGLTKLVSSEVEQASGRVGSRGSSDICVAQSFFIPLLCFPLLWFLSG